MLGFTTVVTYSYETATKLAFWLGELLQQEKLYIKGPQH